MSRSCTLKGNKLDLEGPELRVGSKAPDATLRKSLVESVRITETNGRPRILSVVPSLDTPVCAQQTRRFNEEAAKLAGVGIFAVSCDLPTAMARFCGAEGIDPDRIQVLSDHFDLAFGRAYGTLIPSLRILCRAVFVLDAEGTIRHAEYVPEVADHPDYEAVLASAKGLLG